MPEILTQPATVATARHVQGDSPDIDPTWTYVGRPNRHRGWPGSVWSNPFWMGRDGFGFDHRRVDRRWLDGIMDIYGFKNLNCVVLYALWLETNSLLLARLPELASRTLICWCGVWKPGDPDIGCHAQVLAERVNALAATTTEDHRA